MTPRATAVAALLALLAPAIALAADRHEAVTFAAGATTGAVSGAVKGRDNAFYTVRAAKGQTMTVTLSSGSPSVYFNVYRPGDRPGHAEALFSSAAAAQNAATLTLDEAGTYTVQVYLFRNAAREGRQADYKLTVGVKGAPAAASAAPAPAAARGWVVSGVTTALNLRTKPSADARVVGTVRGGAALDDLGCQTAGGRTWCKVRTTGDASVAGWVARDYLARR